MTRASRVVVCVFDGLRPDLATHERMPALAGFLDRSRVFSEARTVFPSVTRVATTSIATGAFPNGHGVVGNAFYYPQVTTKHAIDVSSAADIALADAHLDGGFVAADAFGAALARAGKSVCVVHTGSAGSAYCINPRVADQNHWTFSMLGAAHTRTPDAVREVVERFGPLPTRTLPRFEETDYAARVMTELVIAEKQPDVALIWFNEPDTSFHYRCIGSQDTRAIMARVDAAFARILDAIAARPDADDIAVIVASDHGQISSYGEMTLRAS